MKTLHLAIIISAIVVIVAISILEIFFKNPPNGGYLTAQTNVIPQGNNSTHACLPKKDPAFDPGGLGATAWLCPIIPFHTYTQVIDYSGFDDVCVDQQYDGDNYMLRAGYNGSFTYKIYPDVPLADIIKMPNTNITNYASFSHYIYTKSSTGWTYTQTIDGVSVSFEPKSEVIWPWSSSLVTAKISTSPNAQKGSHWLILSPGACNGGPAFILTIDNSSSELK